MQSSELEVRLDNGDVTRRVLISSDALLGDLHALVQTSMGWNDTAFHSFVIGGAIYGDMDDDIKLWRFTSAKIAAGGVVYSW